MKLTIKAIYRSSCSRHKVKYAFKGTKKELKLFFKQRFLKRTRPFNLSVVDVMLPAGVTCKVTYTNLTDAPNSKLVKRSDFLSINVSGAWDTFMETARKLNNENSTL